MGDEISTRRSYCPLIVSLTYHSKVVEDVIDQNQGSFYCPEFQTRKQSSCQVVEASMAFNLSWLWVGLFWNRETVEGVRLTTMYLDLLLSFFFLPPVLDLPHISHLKVLFICFHFPPNPPSLSWFWYETSCRQMDASCGIITVWKSMRVYKYSDTLQEVSNDAPCGGNLPGYSIRGGSV